MGKELFKFEDRGGGYRSVSCPEHPGFSAILKPGEVWFSDDHVRTLIVMAALDATAGARIEIERLRAAQWPAEVTQEMCEAVYKLDLGTNRLGLDDVIDIYDTFKRIHEQSKDQ